MFSARTVTHFVDALQSIGQSWLVESMGWTGFRNPELQIAWLSQLCRMGRWRMIVAVGRGEGLLELAARDGQSADCVHVPIDSSIAFADYLLRCYGLLADNLHQTIRLGVRECE